MVDIIIPLGTGSKWKNNELKYSLRSIEKYLTGFRDIIIVGELPACQNIVHIPFSDRKGCKQANIMRKFREGCIRTETSQRVLLWNDDYILQKHIDVSEIVPVWYLRLKQVYDQMFVKGPYTLCVRNTMQVLEALGHDTKHFDIHLPWVVDKDEFMRVVDSVDYTMSNTFLLKSLVLNMLDVGGEETTLDVKVKEGKFDRGGYMYSLPEEVPELEKLKLTYNFPRNGKYC